MNTRILLVAALFLLSSCGGGGGGGSSAPPSVSAPSGLTYASPQSLVVGQQLQALTPTVSGSVDSYSVAPTLPAGLALNTTSGAISGTPTAITATANYTVTATNTGGITTATVAIAVSDVAPAIAYGATDLKFTTGVPTKPLVPTSTGGTVVTWSVTPALPAGLALSTTDGSISGTPTEVSASKSYTVGAQNTGGQVTRTLNISVESGVLLNLGHANDVAVLKYDGTRIFSQDIDGHWVLWDSQTSAIVAQGESVCVDLCLVLVTPADLAGPTLALRSADGVELRSSVDGHLVSRVSSDTSWWKLASDGSYVSVGNTSALKVWSASGSVLLSRSGDYSRAKAFPAPGELRVAVGPAGDTVIEKIDVVTGSASTTPFIGTFNTWFVDGNRFLTNAGNTVSVYALDGTRVDQAVLPAISNLGGQGGWFWSNSGSNLNVYSVGASSSPAATFTFASWKAIVPSRATIGVVRNDVAQIAVIDLSGGTPVRIDRAVPAAFASTYAALSSARWVIGNRYGVVVDAADAPASLKYYGLGQAWSIVGSAHRFAVATASGRILYFNADTKTQEGQIDFLSTKILLSDGGTVLSAIADTKDSPYLDDRSLKVFALPAGNEIRSQPFTSSSNPLPVDISLSGSGQMFGTAYFGSSGGLPTFAREVTDAAGTVVWSDHPSGATLAGGDLVDIPIRLSPNGTLIAVSDRVRNDASGTNIYTNGTLTTAVPGWAVGWIDDNRLLVNKYHTDIHGTGYAGCSIVSATGQAQQSPALPEMLSIQRVTSDQVYAQDLNSIVSLTSGDSVWSSATAIPSVPSARVGAVAGGWVVFAASGAVVRVEPH